MHKLTLAALVILPTLAGLGCAKAELTPLKGPDGQEWVAITCSRGAKNCWKAAGDFCPNGYESADEVTSTTHGLLFSTHVRDEMLVRCKPPQASAETAVPTRRGPLGAE